MLQSALHLQTYNNPRLTTEARDDNEIKMIVIIPVLGRILEISQEKL